MRAVNFLLGLLLVAMIAAHAAVWRATDVPNVDYLPDMVYSPAAEPFAASTLLPGGRVMQPPPAGTVARGASLSRYEATSAGAERAGLELAAPPAGPGDEARGAAVYASFCTPCHGGDALGQGPVVARGFPAPPSLLAPKAAGMTDGQMFHIVTYGQLNMPGYASQVAEADRWRVVAHVRQLQRGPR